MRASKPSVCQLFCILLLGWLSFVNTLHAREVKVGVYANAPKVMLGADGQPSGIFGDLLREIAAKEDWTLVPVVCEWQACLDATRAGQIDLMTDVAHSEARAQIFSFHQTPAINSWSQVYQRTGLSIQSMLDLQNRRVAILQGSVQQDYFSGLLSSFGVQPIWVPVNSLAEGFTKVSAGEADVVVSNHQFGSLQAPRYMLVETPIMFQPSRLFYATGKGRNADLLAALDQHLNVWRDDPNSVYFDVLKRWGGEPPRTLVPRAFWWILFALGTLLLLAIVFVSLLRRQVREKTRHLLQSEDKLSTILNSVESYIYIKDPQLRYQYTNSIFSASVGRPLVGLADTDLFNAATAEQLQRNDRRVLEHGERVADEETITTADGKHTHTYLSVKLPLRRPDGSIYALCGISTDITELKRSREAIHQLAFYDALTGLPNRRLLMDRMQQILAARDRTAHDGALLFIDLDHFKTLNDTLGHDVGDLLLQQVTKRLKQCTRDQDTLARLGGDEFVVMLQDLSTDANDAARQADAVAGKIVSTLAEPYMLAGQHYQSTVSVGIAMFSDPHSTQEELFKRGDLAMYQAKADGRNTLRFFNPDMQARMSARVALEADLREALVRQEFLLYYQPQADNHGKMLGAEALVRWQHPQRGLVEPGEFIGAAEACGLIVPLGRWILRTACLQLVRWAAQPNMAHLHLAVNVSARQFKHPGFVGDVLAVLDETHAPPDRLKLELTESQLVDDVEAVISKMVQLKKRGVRFVLDDFGTGYSSLSHLKRLPLDQLKIDQSFVRDLLTDPNDEAIVTTIVALGKALEIEVIAEGVETAAQRAALEQRGCLHFQGYSLARPGPAEALEHWRMPSTDAP
ncbi:MAG: EAL domain-containing protein [Burkholderiales bacterium]|nr:EAL domain-containing protein [Burkholderiales bacterium]